MKLKTVTNHVFKKLAEKPSTISVSASILAIVAGLFVGFIVMLVINPAQAFAGLTSILFGPFSDMEGGRSLGNTIYYAVPIILTGLSVAFAFRTGLFNIGATGQLTIGAFVAVYIGVNWEFLGAFHWIVAVLGGMLAGAFWGSIPGLLKAYRNVHEVVSSIMLNYIAMYTVTMLIKETIFNATSARALAPAVSARLPQWFLGDLFPRSSINIGIFIALLLVIITHILLNKTTFGYELKSVGFNRDASQYAGMNEKRNIVAAMAISGGLAGVAGAVMFLVTGRFMSIENHLMVEGFTGIAISLLGLSAPIGVFLAGLFYGALEIGGFYLQRTTNFVPQIIEIIIAVIIYFSALSLFLQKFVANFLSKRLKKDVQISEGSDVL